LFNQEEINSVDQYVWREERKKLNRRIENFCIGNDITFAENCLAQRIQHSKHSKIVYMWLFDIIGSFTYWQSISQQCQQLGKQVLVVTDNIVEFEELPGIEFFSYPELLGVTASYNDIPAARTPSKLYNCFMQRVCSVRQSWFYLLYHYDLLDRGYVSLLLKQLVSYSELTGQELFDFIHEKYQLNQLSHFEQAYQALREKVPYRNFPETNNLLPFILDSKYSLVIETYALEDDTQIWCFTEKSLRTLQFPTIPLLFLQKQGLSKLRNLGLEFDTNLAKIDLLPWQDRQQQLLKILVDDQFDFNSNELYNQSQHNRWLLQSWKVAYNKANFFDNFYTKALSV
jgi:hypothetical protein